MYPAELEIKDTTESTTSASYLDLLLLIRRDGQLHTSIFDKRDYFNFHITNYLFLGSNIPSSPVYGVFIFQPIRYVRDCSSYECFILRTRRLSRKLLKQGYLAERLKSSFRKFYGRYEDLIQDEVSLSWMLNDILTLDQQWLPNRLSTNFMTLIQSLTFTELWVVFLEHLQRMWHASRERLPFRATGSVPHLGTCLCSNCLDQIHRTCLSLLDFSPWIPLYAFSILLVTFCKCEYFRDKVNANEYGTDKYKKAVSYIIL